MLAKVKAHRPSDRMLTKTLAPPVSGLNLVVAAVLRDSLCRVIAALRFVV